MAATGTQGMRAEGREGAIVVGASSGIGAAVAAELARRGYQVALVARRGDALGTLAAQFNVGRSGSDIVARAYVHDVRAYDDAPATLQRIRADLGDTPLRTLVFCSAVMPAPAADGWSFDAQRQMIETNLIGAMRWLDLVGAVFAEQGFGSLVAVSSVAGERGRLGNAAYMASKAGLSTYAESLRYRLASRGVRVVTVKPGRVATPMIEGVKTPGLLVAKPAPVARRIVDAAERGPEVVYTPGYWGPVMAAIRLLPAWVMKRLSV